MKKKTLILVNMTLFVLILATAGLLTWKELKAIAIKDVLISEMHYNELPSFVTVQIQQNDNKQPEFRTYRMSDGKAEIVEGTWNFSYAKPNELFFYGYFPQDLNAQRFFVLNELGTIQKDISKMQGPVINVMENPRATYMLITGAIQSTSTPGYYSCVAEKLPASPYPCLDVLGDIVKDYDPSLSYKSFWNLEHERELITDEQGGQNRIWSFDPWEKKPVLLSSSTEKKMRSEETNKIQTYTFKMYANRFLRITREDNKHTWFVLPKGSEAKWVDRDHIIVIEPGKKVFVYELATRSRALLADLPDDTESISTYYNQE